MANNLKKIEKLNHHIITLEKQRRDALTGKASGEDEIDHAGIQKKIDVARAKIVELRKQSK